MFQKHRLGSTRRGKRGSDPRTPGDLQRSFLPAGPPLADAAEAVTAPPSSGSAPTARSTTWRWSCPSTSARWRAFTTTPLSCSTQMAAPSGSIVRTTFPTPLASGRSTTSSLETPATRRSRRSTAVSASTSATTVTSPRVHASSVLTVLRSSLTPRPRWPDSHSTSGNLSSRLTLLPTVTSWPPATVSVPRRPGASASSTAIATSATRAASSSQRPARRSSLTIQTPASAASRSWVRTSSSGLTATSTSSRRSERPGSSTETGPFGDMVKQLP